ncbi:WD repeat-containing protein-like protein 1 [Calycina marina]|uniref:WD repeat-containing protein-like protein 1 n=1 Tax=Calycina marina TaxID=1763456 RepID=A0A9P7Z3Z4_9HELO|nr:WD repeat-containing protein-like protein 1 [Calycina marina]
MSIAIDKLLAAQPNTERGRPTQLSADPKGERIAYAAIFLRSIDDPAISKQYNNHIHTTTVARFSPSGYFVASGDASGIVKVWDAVEGVNTKGTYPIISGRINDIAWDGDSQRIIAVGDGREMYGRCITADSGNSVGEISGHSKVINTVAIRQQRPMRAATVSDDSSMVFLHGAPFKYNAKVGGLHKGYVYGVGFSPDGAHLVSVGTDRKIQLYDGKTGKATTQIGDGEHTGSIFSVSWAKDSKRLVTASADQSVKLWDFEVGKAVQTWKFGGDGISVPDHQVGVVWPSRSDGLIVSVNLAGDLNYLVEGSSKPTKFVQGHNKAISALGSGVTDKGQTFWTGSYEGRVCSWNYETGAGTVVEGSHTNQLTAFESTIDRTYSVAWDDTLRISDNKNDIFIGEATKLTAQPKGMALADGRLFVATGKSVDIFIDESLVDSVPMTDTTAISAHGSLVAIGNEKHKVEIYTVGSDNKLRLVEELLDSTEIITALAFSRDGGLLAVGNTKGKIRVYNTATWDTKTDRWSAHTARIMSIDWNAEGTHAVSGSLDTYVYVWSLKSPGSRVKAPNAHNEGVFGVCWLDDGKKVASTGGDGALKIWDVKL